MDWNERITIYLVYRPKMIMTKTSYRIYGGFFCQRKQLITLDVRNNNNIGQKNHG